MKSLSIKNKLTQAAIAAAGLVALIGFAAVTERAEQRAVRALDSVVTAPGKLYSQPAAPVQLSTVVITTKRAS